MVRIQGERIVNNITEHRANKENWLIDSWMVIDLGLDCAILVLCYPFSFYIVHQSLHMTDTRRVCLFQKPRLGHVTNMACQYI